jgi:hypothetical protein
MDEVNGYFYATAEDERYDYYTGFLLCHIQELTIGNNLQMAAYSTNITPWLKFT